MTMGGRNIPTGALCAAVLWALGIPWAPNAGAQESRPSDDIRLVDLDQHVRNVAAYASGSVVTVVSIRRFPAVEGDSGSQSGVSGEGRGSLEATVGSGVVINRKGDIITTISVIGEGREYQITTASGEVWDADLVGYDRETRLCLLRSGAGDLQPIAMGRAGDIGPGTMVIIVGRAYGNLPTVSFGAMNERHPWRRGDDPGLISMSAPVYPGNNGGAVLNFKGELIGIVSGTLGGIESEEGESVVKIPPEMPEIATPAQDSQMSFAIPVETLREAVPKLRAGGSNRGAYFGVRVASSSDSEREEGVLISSVVPESPAEGAGLRGGDVIYEYNGIGVTSAEALIDMVRNTMAGSAVEIVFMREGALNTAEVILAEISPYELKQLEKRMTRSSNSR